MAVLISHLSRRHQRVLMLCPCVFTCVVFALPRWWLTPRWSWWWGWRPRRSCPDVRVVVVCPAGARPSAEIGSRSGDQRPPGGPAMESASVRMRRVRQAAHGNPFPVSGWYDSSPSAQAGPERSGDVHPGGVPPASDQLASDHGPGNTVCLGYVDDALMSSNPGVSSKSLLCVARGHCSNRAVAATHASAVLSRLPIFSL